MELFTDSGEDLLQTLGRNRDLATTEMTPIFYAATGVHPYVDEVDQLTLRVTGTVQPSAQIVIDVFYALGA